METRQRDVLPDVLKGFGAILMVLGHCIQSGSGLVYLGNAGYFEDKWYQFIYSFHMPLFMIISGFYAWDSVQRAQSLQDRKRMIVKKCIYLIIPNAAWKILEYICLFASGNYIYQRMDTLLRDICIGILTNFWFLWAILYSFLLVCLMHYKLRDSVWIYILIFLAMFFTPDGLALNAYKYMLPYYLIGFYTNKNRERLSAFFAKNIYGKGTVLVSGIIFFVLFSFYDAGSFIYLTGYKLVGKNYGVQLQIDVYRFLVGLFGIIFWSLLWKELISLRKMPECIVKMMAYLGRRGFGIYIISCILVSYIVCPIAADWKPQYGVNIVEMVIVLFASVAVIEVFRRIKWVCMLVGEDWKS